MVRGSQWTVQGGSVDGTEAAHLAADVDGASRVDCEGPAVAGDELVADGVGDAVARQDDHVALHVAPCLEHLQRHARVQL
eukprot:509133-Prorocentrum_minimum.AAC.1